MFAHTVAHACQLLHQLGVVAEPRIPGAVRVLEGEDALHLSELHAEFGEAFPLAVGIEQADPFVHSRCPAVLQLDVVVPLLQDGSLDVAAHHAQVKAAPVLGGAVVGILGASDEVTPELRDAGNLFQFQLGAGRQDQQCCQHQRVESFISHGSMFDEKGEC